MLKQYLPYKLLSDEIIKRDYFLSTVEKDQNWKGGPLQVPFVGANASTISFGSLASSSDISNDVFVRGEVAGYKELWGSMSFNQRDLDEHGNLEQSFLSILPDRIDVFAQTMKEALSGCLLKGGHIAVVDSIANVATGTLGVDRPEVFQVGMKIEISSPANDAIIDGCANLNSDEDSDFDDAGESGITSFYVKSVDLVNGRITCEASRGGAVMHFGDQPGNSTRIAAVDDKVYRASSLTSGGVEQNLFTSLPSQLLASSASLFGQTKANYPHLQAYNFDGDAIGNVTSLLPTIFDVQTTVRRLGRGNPSEAIMSYANLAICMKALEGDRTYTVSDRSSDEKARQGVVYGWSEIQVTGVKGSLKLVAVPEMGDDQILILDKSSMKLHSNGFIERREAPDGKQFYETRETTGYSYILDHRFYGDLVVSKPSNNAIIKNINY